MNELMEQVVCNKCGKKVFREIEKLQTKNCYLEMDQPLNILIIKKFKCECGEDKDYKIDLVKSN